MNNETQKAVSTLTQAIKTDPDLYIAYQSNIAMAFVDSVNSFKVRTGKRNLNRREVHQLANEAATHFVNSWTGAK